MRKPLFKTVITGFVLLLSVAIVAAQNECGQFVDRALQAVEESCNRLGRNQACYGFTRVEASFLTDVDANFFQSPADVTDVTALETLRTAPFNLNTNEWGVAVMVLQANVPESLPGQNVTFVLMGDVEVENAVAPDEAHTPAQGVGVAVLEATGSPIRSGPGDNFNVLDIALQNEVFIADGLSSDGQWLRVIWRERPAWILRNTMEQVPAINALPILTDDLRTPMQAFYLRTGIGAPSCAEAPGDSLVVQGPEELEIDLTVNGADIRLGSSGILRVQTIGGRQVLEIIVLDGEFIVRADEFNPQDVIIRAGQRTTLCLEGGNNLGINGLPDDLIVTCAASPPEPANLSTLIGNLCTLDQLPGSLLNYDLTTCGGATPPPPAAPRTHTVSAGENLFRIARFYCVDQTALAQLNNITNVRQIFVGQVLTLPAGACAGEGSTRPPTGSVPPPPVVNPPTGSNPPPQTAACTVDLIYPLVPVNSGNHTFQWTSVPIAGIQYELVFFTFEGIAAERFYTPSPSYSLNLGADTSTGGSFFWQVNVLQNGTVLCSTPRSPRLTRTGDMNPPIISNDPPPPLTLTVSCSVDFGFNVQNFGSLPQATITGQWFDLPDGLSVVLEYFDGFNIIRSAPSTDRQGTLQISGDLFGSGSGTLLASNGDYAFTACDGARG